MRRTVLVLAMVGCGGTTEVAPPGTQIGQEGDDIPCETTFTEVSDPSVNTGGLAFSADDYLAASEHGATGTLTLPDDSTLPMTLDFTVLEPVEHWVESRPEGARSACDREGYIAQVDLTIDAGEALFATHRFELRMVDEDRGGFFVSVEPEGTLAPDTLDPAEWVSIRLVMQGERQDAAWRGMASWLASGEDGNREEVIGEWEATVD